MNSLVTFICAVAAVLLAVFPVITTGMKIWVYSELNPGAKKWVYKFSTTQRCYTFSSCLDGTTIGADWDKIDDAYAIVFYTQDECQGKKAVSKAIPKGQLVFDFGSASIGANSFMVWEQGMYATRGFTKDCMERAEVNGRNSSGNSSNFDDISLP